MNHDALALFLGLMDLIDDYCGRRSLTVEDINALLDDPRYEAAEALWIEHRKDNQKCK